MKETTLNEIADFGSCLCRTIAGLLCRSFRFLYRTHSLARPLWLHYDWNRFFRACRRHQIPLSFPPSAIGLECGSMLDYCVLLR